MSLKTYLTSIIGAATLQLCAADFSDTNYAFSHAITLANQNKPQTHRKEDISSWTFSVTEEKITPPSQAYPSQMPQSSRSNLEIITNQLPPMQVPGQRKVSHMYIQLQIMPQGKTRDIITYQTQISEINDLGVIRGKRLYSQRPASVSPAIMLIYEASAGGIHMMPDEIREVAKDGLKIYFIQGKNIISNTLDQREIQNVKEQKISNDDLMHLGKKHDVDYYLVGEQRAEKIFNRRIAEMIYFFNAQKNNLEAITSPLLTSSSWDDALARK
ncbi:MAG TPA: hypothetical protein VK158_04875 [Acidobacteriota bacterium]|nr:hypothetical protein [Acidobacteriota bacterium]